MKSPTVPSRIGIGGYWVPSMEVEWIPEMTGQERVVQVKRSDLNEMTDFRLEIVEDVE